MAKMRKMSVIAVVGTLMCPVLPSVIGAEPQGTPAGLPGVIASMAVGHETDGRVEMELLPGARSVHAGDRFVLGVRFLIEPEWHIYWLNPGDSGITTTLEIGLPEGYRVHRLMYPGPVRFVASDGAVTYGYEKEVVLLAEIDVPDDAQAGDAIDIAVRADWLVCKVACFMGDAEGQARVKVVGDDEPTRAINGRRLEQWKARVPQPLSALGEERASWSGSRAEPTLEIAVGEGEKAEFFPLYLDGVEAGETSLDSEANVFRVPFAVKNPTADPAPVYGVVRVYSDDSDRYFEVVHGLDE